MPRKPDDIDAFDRAILRILQRDNKTPQRTIAEAVNLSAAAVQRRIAAMEKSGVIAANVAIVDPEALSLGVTAVVEVFLRDERTASIDRAKTLFRGTPEVQQCYYTTGGTSFVLIIVTADMRAYEALTRRLFSDHEWVASFRTLVALDRVKSGAELLVP
ncbi:Lrp/AsnC family transcriptional regulator [Novosphingobium panipatense]|jgi:DNA-binding Lrp family transcriptional regulator|uniref:Lrp/AsnC family transcriptional regulator n=1 Tax=Novosphingobium TaxID=165696 RepID=UPI000CDB7FB7|nr:Lrp/AsnC family transcriptional regulator [Novosphingobium sp. HII-3]